MNKILLAALMIPMALMMASPRLRAADESAQQEEAKLSQELKKFEDAIEKNVPQKDEPHRKQLEVFLQSDKLQEADLAEQLIGISVPPDTRCLAVLALGLLARDP
jgi:hypothetical protein